jgi:hypothetical protein
MMEKSIKSYPSGHGEGEELFFGEETICRERVIEVYKRKVN